MHTNYILIFSATGAFTNLKDLSYFVWTMSKGVNIGIRFIRQPRRPMNWSH